jgi:hypothetical protein
MIKQRTIPVFFMIILLTNCGFAQYFSPYIEYETFKADTAKFVYNTMELPKYIKSIDKKTLKSI